MFNCSPAVAAVCREEQSREEKEVEEESLLLADSGSCGNLNGRWLFHVSPVQSKHAHVFMSDTSSCSSPDSRLLVAPHIWGADEEPTFSSSNLHSIWIHLTKPEPSFTSYFKLGSHEVTSGSRQGQR